MASARNLLNNHLMQMRALGFIAAVLLGSTGCGSTVEYDEPQLETMSVALLSKELRNCLTLYHLEGESPFGEPLRVSTLRVVADEGIERVQAWLTLDFDPDGRTPSCPVRGEGDILLYEGPPTTDVVDVGPNGPVADDGMALVVVADRAPCETADCELRELEVDVELELLPR